MQIVIREATAEDATAIAIVQAYTWLTTYKGLMPDDILQARVERVPSQAEYIAERIRNDANFIVAESGGAVIGFACRCASRDANYSNDGEIQALYVLQAFHGKQIGRGLFERCAEQLRAEGFNHLIVNCLEGNPSMGFYERLGGKIVGQRVDELPGGHVIRENVLRFKIK